MHDLDNTVQTYINELFFDGPFDDSLLAEPQVPLSSEPALNEVAKPSENYFEGVGFETALDSKEARGSEAYSAAGRPSKELKVDETAEEPIEGDRQNAFLERFSRAQLGGLKSGVTRVDQRPEWGKESFDCLVFSVAGLKMAIAVQFIEGLHVLHIDEPYVGQVSLPEDIADFNLPNASGTEDAERLLMTNAVVSAVNYDHNPVYLGRMKQSIADSVTELESYLVLDTARLVMPERYDVAMQQSYRYALTLKGFDWCFAVDSVGDELTLAPQSVRWRSEHTRREWLAGTVVDKMCALIDVQTLDRHLLAERVLF